jgi:hypothetical protein
MNQPPIPPDADLRHMPGYMIDIEALLNSELAATGDPAANWFALLTWCASMHQVPAGSLPDDDRLLAYLVRLGRDVRTWRKMRENGALRGWEKHDDGRLYHPVVTQKVLGLLDKSRKAGAATARREARKNVQVSENTKHEKIDRSSTDDHTIIKGREGKGREEKGRRESIEASPQTERSPAPEEPSLFADEPSPLGESLPPTSSAEEMRARASSAGAGDSGPAAGPAQGGAGGALVLVNPGGAAPPARDGAAVPAIDNGFETFWRVYPRKVDKASARKAFDRAVKARKATAGELAAGAAQYALERSGQDPKFTKHPATWINGECWRNEPEPPAGTVPRVATGAAAGILSYFEEREGT